MLQSMVVFGEFLIIHIKYELCYFYASLYKSYVYNFQSYLDVIEF